MKKLTEAAIGWGLRVGGPLPYIAYEFHQKKDGVELTEPYHRAVRVAIVPVVAARKAGLLRKLDGAR